MRTKRKGLSSAQMGVVLLIGTLVLTWALFSKDKISTMLMSGEQVTVHFDRAYKLRPDVSEVKVGFVPVGVVTDVNESADGTAVVSLKVDEGVLKKLGTDPSAAIRATTVLGGSYFVDLSSGGDPGNFASRSIPVERTDVPVELDKIARALQPDALTGLTNTVESLDATLDKDGRAALQRLLDEGSSTLTSAGDVAKAAQGTNPKTDLAELVKNLESTARVLNREPGQLDAIVRDLERTTTVLANRRNDLAESFDQMPETLESTRTALARLDPTLDLLQTTAADARPVATELKKTLDKADPVLIAARPVVSDLRTVVRDARPAIRDLIPGAQGLDSTVRDLKGPVLERLNGPINTWLYANYEGKRNYALSKSKVPMYQEIALTFANLSRGSSNFDQNGHVVSVQAGVGTGSIGGLPLSTEQIFKVLTAWYYPDTPIETLAPLNGPSPYGNDATVAELLSRILGGRQ